MPDFSIDKFHSSLRFDGARAGLFEVLITNPIINVADIDMPFHVRAANAPESVITPIEVPYKGRFIKVAGTRPSFSDWTATVWEDEDFKIRNALETWQNYINSLQGNLRRTQSASPGDYQSIVQIKQFGKQGNILRIYELVDAFPTQLGQIQYSWDTDQIVTYDLTFSYDYWRIINTDTGTAGGV